MALAGRRECVLSQRSQMRIVRLSVCMYASQCCRRVSPAACIRSRNGPGGCDVGMFSDRHHDRLCAVRANEPGKNCKSIFRKVFPVLLLVIPLGLVPLLGSLEGFEVQCWLCISLFFGLASTVTFRSH